VRALISALFRARSMAAWYSSRMGCLNSHYLLTGKAIWPLLIRSLQLQVSAISLQLVFFLVARLLKRKGVVMLRLMKYYRVSLTLASQW
jgi:hypothetical protein